MIQRMLFDENLIRFFGVPVAATASSSRVELVDLSVADSLGGYIDGVCLTASGLCVLTLSVTFDTVSAALEPSGLVNVKWTTATEEGTRAFAVERAAVEDGPYHPVGDAVRAHGPGYAYRFEDPSELDGIAVWYRIVELTVDGRGDVSPPVRARASSRSRGRSRDSARPVGADRNH